MRDGILGIKNTDDSIIIEFKNRQITERIIEDSCDFFDFRDSLQGDVYFEGNDYLIYYFQLKDRFIVILRKIGNWQKYKDKILQIEE